MEKETFAQLEISTKAALHNFKYFRSYLKKETKLLILIKANSYGHGAVDFARLMEKAGADYFAVAHPVEGIRNAKSIMVTNRMDIVFFMIFLPYSKSIPTTIIA